MGIFDFIRSAVQRTAARTAEERARKARDYERKHPDMSERERAKLDEFNRRTERMADFGGTSVRTSSSSPAAPKRIMGRTIPEWDSRWVSIGMLRDANLTPYNHCVGLYRHVVGGKTKYVGRAIELHNGGFRKRLSDYRRDSNSARRHTSGRTIHEHLDEIETYILVVGDTEEAVEATKQLEPWFVKRYRPEWNKQFL